MIWNIDPIPHIEIKDPVHSPLGGLGLGLNMLYGF